MSPRQVLQEFTSYELSEQLAYSRIEPLDDPYWRTGLIASVLEVVNSTKKTKIEPEKWKPVKQTKKVQRQSGKLLKAKVEAAAKRQIKQ